MSIIGEVGMKYEAVYAHSLAEKPREQWQPLEVHSRQVATLAGDFAEAFGSRAWGEVLGWLHDAGKARTAFQRYLAHAAAKAVGLAEFADKHQFTYNRIQLIRKTKGADRKEHFYRLDMAKVQVRNKVKAITDNAALDALFDTDADVDV